MLGTRTVLSALGVGAIAVAGCGGTSGDTGAPHRGAGGDSIPITVLRDPTGTGAAAYVPVTIDRHSYIFRVDTGASRTVINANVAAALRLPDHGSPYLTGTLGCKATAQPVEVSDWRLGDVALPPTTVSSQRNLIDRPEVDGRPISGLLGADVLSRFHAVRLDFATRRLILNARLPRGGTAIPMVVHRDPRGATFLTVRATITGAGADWLIDSGSPTTLIAAGVAAHNRLRPLGKPVAVHGAVGCRVMVTPVAIPHWTAGRTRLPSTIALSSTSSSASRFGDLRIDGFIGAGVLADFDQVTFAFAARRLVLGPKAGSGGVSWALLVAFLALAAIIAAAWRRRAS